MKKDTMKPRKTTVASVAAAMGMAAMAVCAVRADAPQVLAYWPFGDSGLEDASGNGNVLEGGADISDCATFDGTVNSSLSTIGNLDLSGCTDVTIEFFVRAKDNQSLAYLVEHSTSMNDNLGGFLVTVNDRNAGEQRVNALWHLSNASPGYACIDTVPNVLQNGLWHHVALVIKSRSTAAYSTSALEDWCVSLYIDGVISANSGYRTTLNGQTGPCALLNKRLFIGARNNANGRLVGQMDDIRVTAAALTPEQFLQSRTGVPVESLVVGYWPFGTNGFLDVSGSSNHLYTSSGATLGSDGALVLDGTQKFCQTRRPLDLRACTEGLTIECWFNRAGSPSANMPLVYHSATVAGDSPRNVFGTCIGSSGNVSSYAWNGDGGRNNDRTAQGESYVDGEWHHVAWVIDPGASPDTARLYVDKSLADSMSGYESTLNVLGNGFLRLGCGHSYTGTQKLSGKIDDVRVTATALAPAQFMASRTTDFGTAPATPALEPFTLAHWSFRRRSPLEDDAGLYRLTMPRSGTVDFSGGAAVFTGLGGLSTDQPLDMSPYSQLTIEFWINYPRMRDRATEDLSFDMSFLEITDGFEYQQGTFRFSSDAGYMREPARAGLLFKTATSGKYRGHLQPSGSYGDGEWHHWVCHIDNSGSQLSTSLSIDGVAVPADANAFNDAAPSSFTSDRKLNIGWRSGIQLDSGTWKKFPYLTGRMDDIRISAGLRTGDDLIASRSEEADPTASPELRWNFEGENPRADASGNGNDLAPNAAVACSDGKAVFSGNSGFQSANALNLDRFRAVTVELLVRADNPAQGGTQMLIEHGYNYTSFGSTQFYMLLDANGQIRAGLNNNYRSWPGRRMNSSEWTHLALVMDFDESEPYNQVTFYVNGEKAPDGVASASLSGLRGNTLIFLGARGGDTLGFTGAMDDVAISEGALRPGSFVLSRPSPVKNANDVIAYWPFDYGRELNDKTGNGYALTNAAASFAAGCAMLSGAASLATDAYLPFNMYTGLTVECFACIPPGAQQGVRTLFKTTSLPLATTPGAAGVELDATGGSPALVSRWTCGRFKDSAGTDVIMDNVDTTAGTAVDIADGAWHHVALVVDSTQSYGGRSRLFVDGQEMAEYQSCYADRAQAFIDSIFVAGTGITGMLDDLRITGRALVPAEFLQTRSRPKGIVVNFR
ncbi:MAG: hypothetical protein IKO72_09200 [Kiritimatiellae bacterium]|nr:hypothetical protein [Kiritimatiellia bacterium]